MGTQLPRVGGLFYGMWDVIKAWVRSEMGGDRIAGPKVILEPKKKKLLVVDLKKGYLGEDFGNTVPSIMGNVFFISGVSIEQPGFHEMQLPPFDFGKTFSLSYLLGKLLCPERTGPCEKAVRSLRRRALEDAGPVVGRWCRTGAHDG